MHILAKEIAALNAIRLSERLSVYDLADETGVERSTLQRLLKTPGRRPEDTTLSPIRLWLQAPEQRKRLRRAKRKGLLSA